MKVDEHAYKEEPRPCPFCGSAVMMWRVPNHGWVIECNADFCGAEMGWNNIIFSTEDDIAYSWNRRVTSTTPEIAEPGEDNPSA